MGYPKHWMVPQTFAAKVLRATLDSDPSLQNSVPRCPFRAAPMQARAAYLDAGSQGCVEGLIFRHPAARS